MKVISVAFAAVALAAAGSTLAGGADLVQKDHCTACHAVKGPRIGPSFTEIAAKTGGKLAVVKTAIEKGAKTGQYPGVTMQMPPQSQYKADAAPIAKWISSLK